MAVYACTDLHGRYDLWQQIRNQLNTDDTLIFLGDAADRGTYGWLIIKELLTRPNTIYLRGNHEQLLLNRWPEDSFEARLLHAQNGGNYTYQEMMKDRDKDKFMTYLSQTPFWYEYTNTNGEKIFFSHSGSTNIENEHSLIWTRYFWNHPEIVPENYDKIIHGHTPMPYIQENLAVEQSVEQPFYYNDKYCCLDSGAYATGIELLLNVDDFSYQTFKSELNKGV